MAPLVTQKRASILNSLGLNLSGGLRTVFDSKSGPSVTGLPSDLNVLLSPGSSTHGSPLSSLAPPIPSALSSILSTPSPSLLPSTSLFSSVISTSTIVSAPSESIGTPKSSDQSSSSDNFPKKTGVAPGPAGVNLEDDGPGPTSPLASSSSTLSPSTTLAAVSTPVSNRSTVSPLAVPSSTAAAASRSPIPSASATSQPNTPATVLLVTGESGTATIAPVFATSPLTGPVLVVTGTPSLVVSSGPVNTVTPSTVVDALSSATTSPVAEKDETPSQSVGTFAITTISSTTVSGSPTVFSVTLSTVRTVNPTTKPNISSNVKSNKTQIIAGSVIGAIIFFVLISAFLMFILRRRRLRKLETEAALRMSVVDPTPRNSRASGVFSWIRNSMIGHTSPRFQGELMRSTSSLGDSGGMESKMV